MTFPVIPTVAAGRVLFALATNPAGTHTSPNLSSLTKNAGDLLLAIVLTYDGNSTNAEFSAWGGGFTEFKDQATTATMGIGCAYKFSDGTETGTFTVTSADASANDSCFILLSIPDAHASTPPEAGNIANGTSAAADPGSFNPAGWDAEDTLWIAVAGSGETSTTGSYTGVASAPANYGNYADSGISADVVGGVEGAVAFRQLNAASEDVGAFSVDTSNARNSALIIAVRPAAVTGTGALNSPASDVTGDGVSSSSSTDGAISAQASDITGSGISESLSTSAALNAQAATLAGTGLVEGESTITGTGALASQAADITGVGLSSSDSTDGAISSQASALAGAGLSSSLSTDGAISAQASDVTGAGISSSASTDGAISAQAADITGAGLSTSLSTDGAIAAQASDVTGAGASSSNSTDGAIAAQAADITGTGLSASLSTDGAISAQPSTIDGLGVVGNVIFGPGVLVAQASTLSGVGEVSEGIVVPPQQNVSANDEPFELERKEHVHGRGKLRSQNSFIRGQGEVSWENVNAETMLVLLAA